MMLASRRIKKMGFGELKMEAWDTARSKLFSRSPEKAQVIDKITSLLNEREHQNEPIVSRFKGYMADTMGQKLGWSAEARERMEKAPEPIRGMASIAVEAYAREHGYRIVNEQALDEALSSLPFAQGMKKGHESGSV